jgi:hypothetical protein
MSKSVAFRSLDIMDCHGRRFGARLLHPLFRVVDGQSNAANDLRTLRIAIQLVTRRAAPGRRERLLVPVDIKTLEQHQGEYEALLDGISQDCRQSLFVEVAPDGGILSQRAADFCQLLQENYGLSLAVWTTRGDDLAYVEGLVSMFCPAVLGIDKRSVAAATELGNRQFILDASEVANAGGARLLADGIDSDGARACMVDVGVELLCGGAVSGPARTVREVNPVVISLEQRIG